MSTIPPQRLIQLGSGAYLINSIYDTLETIRGVPADAFLVFCSTGKNEKYEFLSQPNSDLVKFTPPIPCGNVTKTSLVLTLVDFSGKILKGKSLYANYGRNPQSLNRRICLQTARGERTLLFEDTGVRELYE
jgi:hypothetical protein